MGRYTAVVVALVRHVVVALVGSVVAGVALLGYSIKRLPPGSPFHVAQSLLDGTLPHGDIVALIGDSHTHGLCGADWVPSIRERYRQRVFVNAGMNCNLAWNVGQRLSGILDLDPRAAVVLIGSNDAMATLNDGAAQVYMLDQGLPQLPSADFFRDNLRRILGRLREAGVHRRAVVTLPPLGEDPASEYNKLISAFNNDIRAIGAENGAVILPLNEKIWKLIHELRLDGPPPRMLEYLPDNRRVLQMVKSLAQHYAMGKSWDEISAASGLVALSDNIHLNDRGGKLLEDLVSEFLSSEQS